MRICSNFQAYHKACTARTYRIQKVTSPKQLEQSHWPVRAALQREHMKQAKTSCETHKQQEAKQRAQLQLSISAAREAASPLGRQSSALEGASGKKICHVKCKFSNSQISNSYLVPLASFRCLKIKCLNLS